MYHKYIGNISMLNKKIDIRFIENFDYRFLGERFGMEYPHLKNKFVEIVGELKNFFLLVNSSQGPLAMMSEEVDTLWHTFVLHTPQYQKFCEGAFGEYFHHQPNTRLTPVDGSAVSNFFIEYQARFGKVPQTYLDPIPSPYWSAVLSGLVPEPVLNQKWSGWPGWK